MKLEDALIRTRMYAQLRTVTMLLLCAGIPLVEHPHPVPFVAVSAVGLVYAAGIHVWLHRRQDIPPAEALTAIDLALLGGALVVAGGPETQVSRVLPFLAVSFAIIHPPRRIVLLTTVMSVAYALIALAFFGGTDEVVSDTVVGTLVATVMACGVGVIMARAFHARAGRIVELDDQRASLLLDALEAEERERGRIAERLHDDVLQSVLAAQQDVREARSGYLQSLEYAESALVESARSLRETVRGIHPAALAERGLEAALRAEIDMVARRGDLETVLEVDDAALGVHDALLFALARELIANAAKHARATRLDVRVALRAEAVVLTVADDGVGIADGATEAALADGHIGLATARQRVRAAGGLAEVVAAPGAGTTIRVWLPLQDAAVLAPAAAEDDTIAALRPTGPGNGTNDPATVRFCRFAARALGADVVFIGVVRDGRLVLDGAAGFPEPWTSVSDRLPERSAVAAAVTGGRPVVVGDLAADPQLAGVFEQRDLGLVACAAMPMRAAGGDVVGVVCMGDRERRRWSRAELESLTELAHLVGLRVQRAGELDRHRDELVALEGERRFIGAVLEGLGEGVVATDEGGRLRIANDAARELVGPDPVRALHELCGQGAIAHADAPDVPVAAEELPIFRALAGESATGEYVIRAGETQRSLLLSASPIADPDGAHGVLMTVQDATVRRAAERSSREWDSRFRVAFDHVPAGMALAELDGTLTVVNEALCALAGRSAADLLGTPLHGLVPEHERGPMRGGLLGLTADPSSVFEAEHRIVRDDGDEVWFRVRSRAVLSEAGVPQQILSHLDDITLRRRERLRLAGLVERDHGSGLLNRRGLDRELRRRIADAGRYETPSALVVLAVDGSLEGPVGMVRLGRALDGCIRGGDIGARGADGELAVIARYRDGDELLDMARGLANRLQDASTDAADRLRPSVSAGVVVLDGRCSDVHQVYDDAREAAQVARQRGGGVVAHSRIQPALD